MTGKRKNFILGEIETEEFAMLVTHEVAGVTLGILLARRMEKAGYRFKNFFSWLLLPAAGLLGSLLPDIPELVKRLIGARGQLRLELYKLTEYGHSLTVWVIILLVAYGLHIHKRRLWTFALKVFALSGCICHVWLDMASHGRGKSFHGENYLMPGSRKVAAWLGFWDYYIKGSKLLPRLPEVLMCLALLAFSLMLINRSLKSSKQN